MTATSTLLPSLQTLFGFSAFRPHQEDIVRAIMAGRDVFAVMPTGGGKSLCYQLPAHLMPGTCLVISPLISLMKDQVDAARTTGLRAGLLNSSLGGAARTDVIRDLKNNRLDLLYVAPERFVMPEFIALLKDIPLAFVAVDEAHCISEWGHDFRPDYLGLSAIVREFPSVPVTAFTATATRRVSGDIVEKLGLRNPLFVRASFNRPNLFYQVLPKTEPDRQIFDFIRSRRGEQGIVYRTTRKSVESTAAMLARNGVRALPYHAGLDDRQRAAHQEAFNRDETDVIVATIAFGMGIDKSNVRFVVHGDLPKNIESYYQETGRAGRDGDPSHCLLLFGYGDIPKITHFFDDITDATAKRHARRCLDEMVRYGSSNACRRKQLLAYFDEQYPRSDCGMCDVCAGDVEKADATIEAQMLMSAILRTGSRFGATHVIDVVMGADTEKIRQCGHDRIKTYGVGKDKDKRYWQIVLGNLLAQGWIQQSGDRYPVLQVADKAQAVLQGEARVSILKPAAAAQRRKAPSTGEAAPCNEALFARLRSLRKRLADEQGVPPFVIFSDRTLREMSAAMPKTSPALSAISGVGAHKLNLYGDRFMAAIRDFAAQHPDASSPKEPDPLVPPPPKGPSASMLETESLLREGLSLDAIASKRDITRGTVVNHIETLIQAGHGVDIARIGDPARLAEIAAVLRELGTGQLAPVVEHFGGRITYDDARLARAWLAAQTLGHKERTS